MQNKGNNISTDTQEARPDEGFRSGFVALIGLPNVGKSTLLNCLLEHKLSIVTSKAQTTRKRLRGIYSDAEHQAVFVDTPGLLDPRYELQASMRAEAEEALSGADVLLAVVDLGYEPSVEWAASYSRPPLPSVLCLNKRDRLDGAVAGAIEARMREAGWSAVIATDARSCLGTTELRDAILARLPRGPALYPVDELSDAPVREFVAELIRETCFEELGEELPYATAVVVEQFKDRGPEDRAYVEAFVYVERASQKGMVIGAGGRMIRRIGTRSREKVEAFLDRPVYLELRVKVMEKWRKRPEALERLGYPVPRRR